MNENKEIPSVPITTLAGVASLTDLLPVLPLPTPLPSTLSNKSQLFHPRVAEEAAILLDTRDEHLVSLLIQSLMQTSVSHIELKDDVQCQIKPEEQENMPKLLKAIVETNPNVFNTERQHQTNQWNNHSYPNYNGLSPSAGYYSPQNAQSSPAGQGQSSSHGGLYQSQQALITPSASSPNVNIGSPPSQTPPTSSAPNHLSTLWNSTETPTTTNTHNPGRPPALQTPHLPINGEYFNHILPQNSGYTNHQESSLPMDIGNMDKDPLSMSPTHDPLLPAPSIPVQQRSFQQGVGNAINQTGLSPAQASAAPSPLRQEPQVSSRNAAASHSNSHGKSELKTEILVKNTSLMDNRLPYVRIGRLPDELMKKHEQKLINSRKNSTVESDSDDNSPLKAKPNLPVDKEREAIDLARERNWQAVKRKHEEANKKEESEAAIVKPKLRKVERRLVPVIEMLSVDELMETNTYHRFNKLIGKVLDAVDDEVIVTDDMEATDIPEELLLPRYQLQELCAEAAKLKNLGAMEAIPTDRLVRLLSILEKNIRAAEKISLLGDPDDSEEMRQMWMETAMERVMCASDACLTALYVMTSPNMPKRIYLEDVIDRIIMFTKFQLHNTIYCVFDPVYSIQSTTKKKQDGRKKRSVGSSGGGGRSALSRDRGVRELYAHAHETVGLLAELLGAHALTDTTVLHASTVGVSPFFVENVSELQLSALKLVTTIFTKYEQHRRLLLEDILASIARIPSTKHNLRSYQLSSDKYIQMLTALVLQLVQCVVQLPEHLVKVPTDKDSTVDKDSNSDKAKVVDKDLFIIAKYEAAISIGGTFLTSFLNKCRSRSEEVDFRPLFENFVHDLLTTVNKPEWPATELLLSLLGTMLVKYMSDKSMEMSVRVASLEYLGLVAARLRRDTVQSRGKLATMDHIIRDIKAEEEKDGISDEIMDGLDTDEERTQFLQRVLLDYLAVNGQHDQAWGCARHFYITQWYRDSMAQPKNTSPTKKTQNKSRRKYKEESSDDEALSDAEEEMNRMFKHSQNSKHDKNDSAIISAEKFKLMERRKAFLLEKIRPFKYHGGQQVQVVQSYIDYSGAELISQYLASKRSFSQSFDKYLRKILVILCENTIAIRTKAMKCLAMIVEADPGVLARSDMQIGVNRSFLDQSTSVREAAVDLVGKFVLHRPELIDKYYGMLSNRILDTGVSVRKRVIKILKDICIECPEFPKIPEICVKMIRRVNDEEGIRKLVMEVFQNMWFSPCTGAISSLRQADAAADPLCRKVLNITDVVLSSRDIGLEWFQQLLQSLFKPKEDKEDSTKINFTPPKSLLVACQQIVDCLIENLLQLEEKSDGAGTSQRLVACLSTLHLFAKIRPQLLVNHALTLQPYLSLKCQTANDQQIISCVASTLELVVPLMEHPSESFLAQLEEDSVKLILQHGQVVIASCLSCLGSIVNNVTRNYKLIRDVFQKYLSILLQWKRGWEINPDLTRQVHRRPQFRRSLFIVGLLLRHFDFTDPRVIEGLPPDIKEQVFSTLMFFLQLEDEDFQSHTLKALGSVCVRHYEFMLQAELKEFYHYLLTSEVASLDMKADVLKNIEMYLLEEEQRMIRQDKEWSKRSKHENLKEMGDVSSGMASTVIQLYLKEILGSFLHHSTQVRSSTMKVVQLVLAQGLVHPVQIVPYLICMSTDTEVTVSHTADKQLQDIDKKYPGFIHMKSQLGIKLSYELQKILQIDSKDGVIRGYRVKEPDEQPGALNGFLYSLLRSTRPQRRALVLSLLKQFDDLSKSTLAQMLYLADNLAYFPFQVQDEPLFIIHHIDIVISTSGSNLLQLFREGLRPVVRGDGSLVEEDDEDEDAESLECRLPADTRALRDHLAQAQGCLLLLVLKQQLKQTYGLTDAKITQYSPSENVKVYEKAVNRRSNAKFNPKVTITKILEEEPEEELDAKGRRNLINDYLEFKQLMLKFDPDEEDEDEVVIAASTTGVGAGADVDPSLTPAPTSAPAPVPT